MNQIRQYAIVTGSYWAFTITDGALRMLVILYFHQLGFSPFDIAALFILYELCGVFTNLIGGWLGERWGLLPLMQIGLLLQVSALLLLSVPADWLGIAYVMAVQALSGIAKDCNKMSAKASVKKLVPKDANTQLLKWVAILTGSKNSLKGAGFFVGAFLLSMAGFQGALWFLAAMLVLALMVTTFLLRAQLGAGRRKHKFSSVFSKSSDINRLSLARFFLFGARDIWFVVALPVFLLEQAWSNQGIGAFMALWIIAYGAVQMMAPRLLNRTGSMQDSRLSAWSFVLLTLLIIMMVAVLAGIDQHVVVVVGLVLFGIVFAVNSSLHSYLVLLYANDDKLALDVGFYYMANAGGRLVGTLLSGWVYQQHGMLGCLWWSAVFVLSTGVIALFLSESKEAEPAAKVITHSQ